jgi:hypothetical protein
VDLFRLADLDRPPGALLVRAAVAQGFSEPVARAGLLAELEAWTAEGALGRVLSELPADLAPQARPRSLLVIAARTLPASAMRAVLMARLLGARVLFKPARGQELLGEALAGADPAVEVLPAARGGVMGRLGEVDSVVVLGTDATVREVRARVRADQGFAGYGHRVSAAWLDGDGEAALLGLARDLCAWDQAGCLSPQVAWTLDEPRGVAESLAAAIGAIEAELPMRLPQEAAWGRYQARALAAMRGQPFDTKTALVAVLDDPTFRPSPGHRMLWVLPADPAAVAATVSSLSTLGWGGHGRSCPRHEAVRLCPLGEMQRPPLEWPHDGRPNLLPLLRPGTV